MANQIIDLLHYHIPEGSLIVTATVRCSESTLSSNTIALYHKLLGSEGEVIRMTQLSPDSAMLVGHKYNDGASGAYNREGSMLHNPERTSSFLSEAADDHVYRIDDDGDAEYDNGEQGDTRSRRRTRVPWLEPDDVRLLAYVKTDIDWKVNVSQTGPSRNAEALAQTSRIPNSNLPRS
jgi:hypothetical protein